MNRYPWRLPVVALVTVACLAGLSVPLVAAHLAPAGRPATLTVAAIYRHVQQTISRPGMLYYATSHFTQQIHVIGQRSQYSASGTMKLWVDARRNVMRQEQKYTIREGTQTGRGTTTTILTPRGGEVREDPAKRVFKPRVKDQPWTCPGATLAASAVLPCPSAGLAKPSTTLVPHGQYAGRPAIVVVTVGIGEGGSGPVTETRRLYLDPPTFLPMALEIAGLGSCQGCGSVIGSVRSMRVRWVYTYAHTFIPVRTVPAHFFDPATLGTPHV